MKLLEEDINCINRLCRMVRSSPAALTSNQISSYEILDILRDTTVPYRNHLVTVFRNIDIPYINILIENDSN
jgi:hypothetical protein